MNINLTILGQIISLAVFVWFCMKYVWPFIIKALNDREARIADGLAAAEKGVLELQQAEERVREMLEQGKQQAQEYITQAQKRADEVVEQAKDAASHEGQRILDEARAQITQEIQQARDALRAEVSTLALTGAEQILMREVDAPRHKEYLDRLSAQL